MKKICLKVAYDGTDFHGFQRQEGRRTIQGTLEDVLKKITLEKIELHGAGRTDAGVHALGQMCHFYTSSTIDSEKFRYILNRIVPPDIVIINSMEVDSAFDVRKSACWKMYRYEIETSQVPDIRTRRFKTQYLPKLDVVLMQKAAAYLVGTHDFTSLCSAKTPIENKVRTIYRCDVKQESSSICIEITGSGFLYHMVRTIVGTLIKVGRGRFLADRIPDILALRDRESAGPTFPPQGLTLVHISYEPWEEELRY